MRRGPSPGLLSAQAHSTAWKEGQGALRPVSPRAAPVIGPDPQQAHVSQWEDASLMPASQKLGLCWNFKPPSPNLSESPLQSSAGLRGRQEETS